MKSGIIVDLVRFEIMVYVGPEDIVEGKNIMIRSQYCYQILEMGMGIYDVINLN